MNSSESRANAYKFVENAKIYQRNVMINGKLISKIMWK